MLETKIQEVGETDRLRKYLTKWREMASLEATYEGLQNMILRDQFFITCNKPLQTLLKEKGKLYLKEITQAADNYVEAHGYEMNQSKTKQNKWNKSNTVNKYATGQNVIRANTVICEFS